MTTGRRRSCDYLLFRFPKISEQIPLRQATTTTPMVRKTTVRFKAFIPFLLANLGLQFQFYHSALNAAPWCVAFGGNKKRRTDNNIADRRRVTGGHRTGEYALTGKRVNRSGCRWRGMICTVFAGSRARRGTGSYRTREIFT